LARLSPEGRRFHRLILEQFAAARTPSGEATRAAARELGLEPERAYAVLAREDLVHADERGRPVVAYPFSARDRGHRVLIDGSGEVQAMCAVDALGIPAMLGAAVDVRSRDPLSGGEVRVQLGPGESVGWHPDGAVVLAGSACGDGPSVHGCCDVLNFFETAENAERYLLEHPEITGMAITIPEAAEAGRVVFGEVFQED
jgi:Alkylmercury lyase